MPHPKGMHPGAVWRKADLQVHTPRDPQWDGPKFKGGTPADETAREAWADDFVQACIDRKLEMVSVTDHHDLCAQPYILRAIGRLPLDSPKPWIFPGMEVTCDDSAQCLVIFDVFSDSDLWDRLYGGHLLNIAKPSQSDATAPQAIPCGRNVDDFLANIAEDPHLSQRVVVLPNGGDEGSHKTIIRTGFAPRFRDLAFDGVYADKGFEDLKDITVRRIYGQIQQWGTRRRGIIPTGDNRSKTFEKLGSRPCFIKIGEPTAEGIRQVLLADEARISYTEPAIPTQRILELHVTSTLCGSDFRLSMNDGYTALIGGRGSGKSAIL
jgi:chromosome segregation protein